MWEELKNFAESKNTNTLDDDLFKGLQTATRNNQVRLALEHNVELVEFLLDRVEVLENRVKELENDKSKPSTRKAPAKKSAAAASSDSSSEE